MFKNKKTELTIEETEHRKNLYTLYNGVIVCAVFVWVLRFALGGLAGLTAPYLNNYYLGTLMVLLADGISIVLPFIVFQKFRRDPFRPVFLEKPRSEHPVLRCVIGVVSVFCLSFVGMALMDYAVSFLDGVKVYSAITRPDFGADAFQTGFYVIVSTLVYSFAYEFSFRGIAVRAMRDENRAAAVFVSGIAFAFSDGEPHHVLVRLLVGFLISAFYLRVRSLWMCIVLHAASQCAICFRWLYPRAQDSSVEIFMLFIALLLGVVSAVLLFIPRREKEGQITRKRVAFKVILTSFGVWLLTALLAFNIMSFTFYMDDAPNLETPEQGWQDPMFNNPTDRQENIPDYQEFPKD